MFIIISHALCSFFQIQNHGGIQLQSSGQHKELLRIPIRKQQLLMPINSRVVSCYLGVGFVKNISLINSGYIL